LEQDSARKAAFEEQLKYADHELERLKYQHIVPERLAGAFASVQASALGVLAAILDLIGSQLTYLNCFLRKFGTSEYIFCGT
jgi:hypothetical protein